MKSALVLTLTALLAVAGCTYKLVGAAGDGKQGGQSQDKGALHGRSLLSTAAQPDQRHPIERRMVRRRPAPPEAGSDAAARPQRRRRSEHQIIAMGFNAR